MDVNWLAVVIGSVVGFFVGGLWYSKGVFGLTWGIEAGVCRPDGTLKSIEEGGKHPKHPAKAFVIGILMSFVSTVALAWWLGPKPELGYAVTRAVVAGACFVGASFGINYQFANRTTKLWLIDAGYHTAQFTVIGLVLGLLR